LNIKTPKRIYQKLLEELTGIKTSSEKSLNLLDELFKTGKIKGVKCVKAMRIIVFDEIDFL
jgi:Cdc6-like AAA superfamily ATPase